MYLALLLSGIYLGGVLVMWVDAWMRHVPFGDDDDEGISVQAMLGCFGWPVGLVVLLALGRNKAREALGYVSPRKLRDELRVVEDKLHVLESDLTDVREDTARNMEEVLEGYRQAVIADVMVQIFEYEDHVETQGVEVDLAELRQRIFDRAFPAKNEQEKNP